MFTSWIILIFGYEVAIRMESFSRIFPVSISNKLRFTCYFAAWSISFLIFWAGLSSFQTWYLMFLALILLPVLQILLKRVRKSQIPVKSLALLDLMLLHMKGGNSLRSAVIMSSETEKTWFKSFQKSLLKGLELGVLVETRSRWFDSLATEIIEVEKSRNKTVEQLEVLRKYARQEIQLKRKMKNATSGPRAQVIVMTVLFAGLNALAIKNWNTYMMKNLLPAAWLLFLLGVSIAIWVMRSFKWKV